MYDKTKLQKQKRKYFKIFNLEQAKFFYKGGANLIDFDKERGYVYHLFDRDDIAEDLFTQWCTRSK